MAKGPNEHLLARKNEERMAGSRHQRRAIEAQALAEARSAGTGLSIPALKKLIRRKTKERMK